MLLTLTTTAPSARDLGYLLTKHPDRPHSFALAFGTAHVLYPEATDARCTAALVLEVDPVGLVRGRGGSEEGPLAQYVNDRPYAASSLLSVALARVFGSALRGQCRDRPELVEQARPLEAELSALPCRGGVGLLVRLFEPLGYAVEATPIPLDAVAGDDAPSRYVALRLSATTTLRQLLEHLYVLIPVLDDDKHYWVGEDEVEKLMRYGQTWLEGHPERELIARRYLKHQGWLTRKALAALVDPEGGEVDPDARAARAAAEEEAIEAPLRLHDLRLMQVADALEATGAERVLDLGCGEGKLLRLLMKRRQFKAIVGMDVSAQALVYARERLRLEELPPHQQGRVVLLHGSLGYRDARLAGFDAAALVEVIEHLEPSRLEALERVVFEFARPRAVIVTTPNVEYNARFVGMAPGQRRHRDHRFEWTRAEFEAWASAVAARHGYGVTFAPVGPEDPALGAPTQLAAFALLTPGAGEAATAGPSPEAEAADEEVAV